MILAVTPDQTFSLHSIKLKLLTLLDLGIWILVYALKLCPTRQKKKLKDQEIESEISEFFCNHENVLHLANFKYFELQFFANILIFIVLIDSTKKTLGYRRSCGVTLENQVFFRFLRGPNGGFPLKNFNFVFTENCLTPNNKSQIIKKHVSY